MTTHLQNRPDDWPSATDEEIIHALFHPTDAFVNPRWMNYLERDRPQALTTYLRLLAAGGGRLGPPARRFLGECL